MTPEDAANLRDWYEDGTTIEALVAHTPFSYRAVRAALLDAGVTLRPPRIPVPPCPPGLVAEYEHGASIRTLAAKHDLSYNQTRTMLLHDGVKLRARGRPLGVRRGGIQ